MNIPPPQQLSAVFASLTAIFAKVGLKGIDSELTTQQDRRKRCKMIILTSQGVDEIALIPEYKAYSVRVAPASV